MVDRTFGPAGQAAINDLLRKGAVALSEAVEPVTVAAIVVTADVVRRQVTVAGTSSRQVATTWAAVAGLDGLTAYIRTSGKWLRKGDDRATELREGERAITLLDVPATGVAGEAVPASVLTTDDRVRYSDPVYGTATFEVLEIRPRVAAGLVTVLTRYARED